MPEVQKVQTWMFTLSTTSTLSINIKLHSNIFSNINVLGYLFDLHTPTKMSLKNMDLMLKKLRKLQHDQPIELLLHHEQIFNKIFEILSLDYDSLRYTDQLDVSIIQIVEEKSDVAFEMLLLMIDLFYGTYPEYIKMFEDYIEKKF